MKILNIVITATLAIILLGAVMTPIVFDAQKDLRTEHVYTSEGAYAHLDKLEVTDSHVLTWAGGKLTIDDVEYPLWSGGAGIAFLSDNVGLYVSNGNLYIGVSGASQAALYSASTLSLIASAGEITYSINDADAVQTTYTMGYILDNDGKYITADGTTDLYYTNNSQISGYRSDGGVLYVMIDGNSFTDGTHVSDFTIAGTDVDGTDGNVKTLSSVKFSSKGLSAFVLPEKVSYWTDDNPAAISLLGALPIIVIAGLVVGLVGAFFIRKNGD